MKKQTAVTAEAATAIHSCDAKVTEMTDLCKVLEYFRYNVGTTLDAAQATKILRNSITYYVMDLERLNLLQAIYIRPDRTTGYKAKHYSADKTLWPEKAPVELNLFGEEV